MGKKNRRENKSKDLIQEEVKLELTPMIDVTFLILIFFMCTLKFKTLEGKLVSYLPTDKGLSNAKQEVEFEDAEIILKIPKEDWDKPPHQRKVIFLRNASNTPFGESLGLIIPEGNEKAAKIQWSPADTPDKILKYLMDVRAASAESKAKINAYSRTPHFYVVDILNKMIEARFSDISYSGIPTNLLTGLQTGEIK